MSKQLIGWKIVTGKRMKNTAGWLIRSLYPNGDDPCFIATGIALPRAGVYVGTNKQFCLDYYTGLVELNDGEFELMLKLDCTGLTTRLEDEERWECVAPTEVKVTCPRILDITPVHLLIQEEDRKPKLISVGDPISITGNDLQTITGTVTKVEPVPSDGFPTVNITVESNKPL